MLIRVLGGRVSGLLLHHGHDSASAIRLISTRLYNYLSAAGSLTAFKHIDEGERIT